MERFWFEISYYRDLTVKNSYPQNRDIAVVVADGDSFNNALFHARQSLMFVLGRDERNEANGNKILAHKYERVSPEDHQLGVAVFGLVAVYDELYKYVGKAEPEGEEAQEAA